MLRHGRLLALVIGSAALPLPAAAQLINLRTVPVASGDQFLVIPSDNLAMGGIALALDDAWLDPFQQPAKGAHIKASQVFATPTFYSVGQEGGSGATLSSGGLFGGGRFFGTVLFALQQLKRGQPFFGPVPLADVAPLPPDALARQSATNKYGTLSVGMRLPGDVALGANATFGDMNAIDGVEHLYAMAADISQSGSLADLRLGAIKDLSGGGMIEGMALYNHFSATHEVTYVDWVVIDSTTWQWEQRVRRETNQDETDTWGLHLGFRRPIGDAGWKVGGVLTGNYKDHPTIPNYDLVNIPRDPGHSTALDVGVGIARQAGAVTVGMDVVYEPGWTTTWATADARRITAGGDTIQAGEHTVDNEFQFSNARVSLGGGYAVGVATIQAGLEVRAVDYHLDQWDNVAETSRRQDEQWMEWVPSWGLRLRLKGVELRYVGRVTTGTGRPGVAWTPPAGTRVLDAAAANDIVAAPSGPLTLQETDVWTHQFSIAVPIR